MYLQLQRQRANADRLGNKIFIAPLVLALSAWIIATVWKKLGANNAVGLSALIALIVVFFVTGAKKEYAVKTVQDLWTM